MASALSIQLLGSFQVHIDGRPLDETEWNLRKAQHLLKLLALAPNQRLHREQIIELLWPESSAQSTSNSLRQTVYVLRRTLAQYSGGKTDFVSTTAGWITLVPSTPARIDVNLFRQAAQHARQQQTVHSYQHAINLYAGELLPEDRYEEWTHVPRKELHDVYMQLLLELAMLQERQGAARAAIETLKQLISVDPLHEEAHIKLIQLYAAIGQRTQALRQYEQLHTTLQHELGLLPNEHAQQLYNDIVVGTAQPGSGALATPANPQSNLPAPLTSFIGRQNDIDQIKQLLQTTRLLTLVGPGGTGKTRLALQVAAHIVHKYAHGVWMIELGGISNPEIIPHAIAATLSMTETAHRALPEMIAHYIGSRELLLVLDNCEHLLEACATILTQLLQRCPNLTALCTSREPLSIHGEILWRVPPLSLPQPSNALAPDDLLAYEAIALFVERGRANEPRFTINNHNASLIEQICRQLDGLPLAIELAAAHVGMLAVEDIAAHLNNHYQILYNRHRNAPQRHQTLTAIVEWSYESLDSTAQRFFNTMAIFANGWTLEAATTVSTAAHIDASRVLQLTSTLIQKSLIVLEGGVNGPARYRMLETLRHYGQQNLQQTELAECVGRRHAEYYLSLAEGSKDIFWGYQQGQWFRQLEREHDNVMAALRFFDEAGDTELELRFCSALWHFWLACGYLQEGQRWLEAALARSAGTSLAARAKALNSLGSLERNQGNLERAAQLFEESHQLYTEIGHKPGLARVHLHLGNAAGDLGDYHSARRHYQISLELWQQLGTTWGIGLLFYNLATVARDTGDYAESIALTEQSREQFRLLDDHWGEAICCFNLGKVAYLQHNLAAATTYIQTSLRLRQQMGVRQGLAPCFEVLAAICLEQQALQQTVLLLGAAAMLRNITGAAILPDEQDTHDQRIASIREQVAPAEFAELWNQGWKMSITDAFELALRQLKPTNNER